MLSTRKLLAQFALSQVPRNIVNQSNKVFAKNSLETDLLFNSIHKFSDPEKPAAIPLVYGGESVYESSSVISQVNPAKHAQVLATAAQASTAQVNAAIESALAAKDSWMRTRWEDRAAVFLKAAELIETKYRYDLLAATMLGQGKNVQQAEIDVIGELNDFLRFNVRYAQEMYAQQPTESAKGVWNRAEYRPLEGFVYAVTPFNFTAIASNLVCAPALMGNTVVWKPSQSALLSNYLVLKVLHEAGLPEGVINFVPGDAALVTKQVLAHKQFAALHFTGSTQVFRQLYGAIAQNVASGHYRDYPRIVGETGGKNFHVIHKSAHVQHSVLSTLRGAFEYQGQKCSAASRAYVAASVYDEFVEQLREQLATVTIGNSTTMDEFTSFMGPVIHEQSYDKVSSAIAKVAEDPELELLQGGKCNKSRGYFIEPTVVATSNIDHEFLQKEFFGPLLTIYKYEDSDYLEVLKKVDATSEYGLTGSIFATDRAAIAQAEDMLRYSAGNFYINDKCTGAVVGQQWFGGSRGSGTNDKAGSGNILSRFVSIRNVKEYFGELVDYRYGSNK